MKYLLDSNTISALYDPEAMLNDRISAHVSALREGDGLYISILNLSTVGPMLLRRNTLIFGR